MQGCLETDSSRQGLSNPHEALRPVFSEKIAEGGYDKIRGI